MSLPAAGVYRDLPDAHRASIATSIAVAARGLNSLKAAAESAAAVVASVTGARAVAIVAGRLPLAVHRGGHDIGPLSPEASAAVQESPEHTRVVQVPVTSVPGPVRLIIVDPVEGDLDGIAETLGLSLDLAATREQVARAERLAALKSDFTAVAGHEIRSPLTSIIGALQTVEKLGTADHTTLELIHGAVARADRLRVLVEDLLMAARIDGRGVPVRPRLMCVVDAAREVVAGTEVEVTSTGRVPSVTTDGDHVRRILTNLVDNALTHGGSSPITVSVRETPGGVEMTIADHGLGLPPEVACDPFSGSHDSATGLGLGLKLAAGLAETIGGSLAHQTTRGGGATFVLTLPLSI